MNKVCLVIPCFNEEESLPLLLTAIRPLFETSLVDSILFVDDGSVDQTWSLIREAHATDKRISGISLSRNFGHQAAVSTGIRHSNAEAIVLMDADLQDPPTLVPELIDKWQQGYQVVHAVREKRQASTWKRLAYFTYYRLISRIANIELTKDSGDFCLMDRVVVEHINALPERDRYMRGLRQYVGFSQATVCYQRPDRVSGEPKYTFWKLVDLAVSGITSFSQAPLRIASWLGLGLFLLSLICSFFVFLWWVSEVPLFGMHPKQVAGWTSLFLMMLLLSGIQMLLLGIQGEYIAKLFIEAKGRPEAYIREICENKP